MGAEGGATAVEAGPFALTVTTTRPMRSLVPSVPVWKNESLPTKPAAL